MTVGERIKARRKELGINAETLAEAIGASRATMYRYENGDIEKVPVQVLGPIADALNTTPAFLMGIDDAPFPENEKEPAPLSENELSIEQLKLVDEIRSMSREECQWLLDTINMIKNKQHK